MSSFTNDKKGDRAKSKPSAGRGTHLLKKQPNALFGAEPELLLDLAGYLQSAKMKKLMERSEGVSPEERANFLLPPLKEQLARELTNYRERTYRVCVTYPGSEKLDDIPLWQRIFERTEFPLCMIAASADIPAVLEKIPSEYRHRIMVGATISTSSSGKWEGGDVLSQLQAKGINVFPRLLPGTPPKDWAKSLGEFVKLFDLSKCPLVWADTSALVIPKKEQILPQKELDAARDSLAQGFHTALKEKADGPKLHFQHRPARRYQIEWERRLLNIPANDTIALLRAYFQDSDEKTLMAFHEKVVHEDASKIESFEAIRELYELTKSKMGDKRGAKSRLVAICEVVWHRKRTQIEHYLDAGIFIHQLKTEHEGSPLPTCEYHVRSVFKLPEKDRIACWLEISKEPDFLSDGQESVIKRVKRYASSKRIEMKSPKEQPQKKLMRQLMEVQKGAVEQFGPGSDIACLSLQLLDAVKAKLEEQVPQNPPAVHHPDQEEVAQGEASSRPIATIVAKEPSVTEGAVSDALLAFHPDLEE